MSDVQENKNTSSDLRGSQSNIQPERQSSVKPPTSKKPVRTSAIIDLNPSKKSIKKSEKGSQNRSQIKQEPSLPITNPSKNESGESLNNTEGQLNKSKDTL